jgi:hypothetical protein
MMNDIEILYDHYKETCSNNKKLEASREKILIYILLTLALFTVQFYSPTETMNTINKVSEYKFGVSISLSFSGFLSLVWGILTILVIRYFQVCVQIERSYKYIHLLESKIDKKIKSSGLFSREGEDYLSKYPLFSNWIWIIYSFILPLGLLILVVAKIYKEITNFGGVDKLFILNIALSIILILSIVLYLFTIHSKKRHD